MRSDLTLKKIAILGTRYGDLDIEQRVLAPLGATLVAGEGRTEKEVVALCHAAQVILCASAPKITASIMRQLPHLTAIVRYGIGVDSIDLIAATRRKIFVANVPDYCVEEVATHAITLILAWTRKLPMAVRSVAKGEWTLESLRPLQSAQDLVVGLVGFGRIARRVAGMAQAIGFRVFATDPYVDANSIRKKKAEPVSFARLIRQADFISLHLPLNEKTRHCINAGVLQRMKSTAYLINTARGELVDERALYGALKRGQIAGAALDVLENEPRVDRSLLPALESVTMTPHCAWYTERSQRALREKACAEVVRILRGKVPKNLVNLEVLG